MADRLELEISEDKWDEKSLDLTAGKKKSKYALKLDLWAKRRGREIGTWRAPRKEEHEDSGLRQATEEEKADFFGLLWEPWLEWEEKTSCERRKRFMQDLAETAAVASLRDDTLLDRELTLIAAGDLCDAWIKWDTENPEPEGDEGDEGEESDGEGEGIGTCPAAGEGDGEDVKRMLAAAAAAAAAREGADELKGAIEGMGGVGVLGGGQKVRAGAISEIARLARSSPQLRRILDTAGKFRTFAAGKNRQKTVHGSDEIMGVTQGGEVARLLPTELALLADPETESLAFKRILERQAMCREMFAREPVGKGPVVVTVDESGSMAGIQIETAKALALTMARNANLQKRWCALVAYSGGGEPRSIVLKPGAWLVEELAEWLTEFMSGGTTRDVPVVELPAVFRAVGAPKGQTDVLMITDAICRLEDHEIHRFNKWKEQKQVRTISIVLTRSEWENKRKNANPLRHVSDEIHYVGAVALGEEIVEKCLAL